MQTTSCGSNICVQKYEVNDFPLKVLLGSFIWHHLTCETFYLSDSFIFQVALQLSGRRASAFERDPFTSGIWPFPVNIRGVVPLKRTGVRSLLGLRLRTFSDPRRRRQLSARGAHLCFSVAAGASGSFRISPPQNTNAPQNLNTQKSLCDPPTLLLWKVKNTPCWHRNREKQTNTNRRCWDEVQKRASDSGESFFPPLNPPKAASEKWLHAQLATHHLSAFRLQLALQCLSAARQTPELPSVLPDGSFHLRLIQTFSVCTWASFSTSVSIHLWHSEA